jgi:hypothetical protein
MFLITFFKSIGKLFARIFKSKEAQDVVQLIFTKLLPEAVPIVAKIRAIVPNPTQATVQDIIGVYRECGQVFSGIAANPQQKKDALRNLAADLLRAALPDKYETPLINSAIELAVAGIQAEAK